MRSPRGHGAGLRGATIIISLAVLASALGAQPVFGETDPLDQLIPDATLRTVPVVVVEPVAASVVRKGSVKLQAWVCDTFPVELRGESVAPETMLRWRLPQGPDGDAGTADDFCREPASASWKAQKPKIAKVAVGEAGAAVATGKKPGLTQITATVPGDAMADGIERSGQMRLTVLDKPKAYSTESRTSMGDTEELFLVPGSEFSVTNEACLSGKKPKCQNYAFNEVALDAEALVELIASGRSTAVFRVDAERAAGREAMIELVRLFSDLARPVILSAHIDPGVPQAKIGDFNDDGMVDVNDARYLFWDHGDNGPGLRDLDLELDGVIDVWDWVVMQQLIEADGNRRFNDDDAALDSDFFRRERVTLDDDSPTVVLDPDDEPLPGFEDDEEPATDDGATGDGFELTDEDADLPGLEDDDAGEPNAVDDDLESVDDDFELTDEDADLPGLEDEEQEFLDSLTPAERAAYEEEQSKPAAENQDVLDAVEVGSDGIIRYLETPEMSADDIRADNLESADRDDPPTDLDRENPGEREAKAAIALVLVQSRYGGTERLMIYDPALDSDGDGDVDGADVSALVANVPNFDSGSVAKIEAEVTRRFGEAVEPADLPAELQEESE
jgi:hypothetical protein